MADPVAREEARQMSGVEEYNKQRIPHPAEDHTIIPVGTIELGQDGSVKKMEMPDASSVVGIVARNLKELGYIHITPTERGATVAWSSAQPATSLSRFLQALGFDVSAIEATGGGSSDSSERGSLDIPDSWAPDDNPMDLRDPSEAEQ